MAPSCGGVAAVVTGITIAAVVGASMAGIDTMAAVLGRPVVTGKGPVDINATASDGTSPTTVVCRSAAHMTGGQGLRRGFGTSNAGVGQLECSSSRQLLPCDSCLERQQYPQALLSCAHQAGWRLLTQPVQQCTPPCSVPYTVLTI